MEVGFSWPSGTGVVAHAVRTREVMVASADLNKRFLIVVFGGTGRHLVGPKGDAARHPIATLEINASPDPVQIA